MKTVELATFVVIGLVGTSDVLAQGTVIFNNRLGATTHVWGTTGGPELHGNSPNDNPAGSTLYTGMTLIGAPGLSGLFGAATTFAALLGAPGSNVLASSLQPASAGGVTTFRTGATAGNIVQTTATFNNIPKDAPVATFEMAVWDNSSGLYSNWTLAATAWNAGLIIAGTSSPFVLQSIGGDINTPPLLTTLTSFSIAIPEPSSFALGALTTGVFLALRRRK